MYIYLYVYTHIYKVNLCLWVIVEVLEFIQSTTLHCRKDASFRTEKKKKEVKKTQRKPSIFFYTLTFNIVTNFVYHQIFEINKYAIL